MATNVSLTVPFKTKKMKINQADTAINCFHSMDKKQFEKEETKIMDAIQLGYVTRATIANHTGISISNVSRALNNLEVKGKIYIKEKKPCPITKIRVRNFAITEQQLCLILI